MDETPNPQSTYPQGPPVSDIVTQSPVQTMPAATPQAPSAPQAAPQVGEVHHGRKIFSMKNVVISLVVIVLLAIAGVALYFYFSQPSNTQNPTPTGAAPSSSQSQSTSPTAFTDQQLNSDLSSVDSGLGSAGSDLSGANQGLSDQAPDLSK